MRALALLVCLAACSTAAPPDMHPPRKRPLLTLPKLPKHCEEAPALTLVETTPVASELDDSPRARTHEVWRTMIQAAERTLDIEQFYVSNDEHGRLEPIIVAIELAAKRGVKVRLLADASFAKTYPETLDRLAAHVEVRRFDVSQSMGGVEHAKYFVVDGCDAYFGSANFDWRSLEHIHELGLRIKGVPMSSALLEVFELDWALAGGTARPAPTKSFDGFPIVLDGDLRLSPALSPLGYLPDERSYDLPQIIAAIDAAKKSVRVELLSFETVDRQGERFDALDAALRRAGLRGAHVELLVSHWSTRAGQIEQLKELTTAPGVEVRIATIVEHPSGFMPYARVIHAKYMVVDDRLSWVGTSNWGADYFKKSRNVGAVIEGERLARELAALFDDLWTGPYAAPVDPKREYPPPRIGR